MKKLLVVCIGLFCSVALRTLMLHRKTFLLPLIILR